MKCFDNDAAPAERPRAALAVVAAAIPLHLALAVATDLSPDEAYYLVAARLHRDIVDHPPLLLWLLRLGDHLPWAPVELRVRLFPLLLSLGTSLAWVELARRRGAGPRGVLLVAWLSAWALLPTVGGFVATPDGPLLLAVVLALLLTSAPARGASLLVGALAKVTALPVAGLLALGLRAPVAQRIALGALPLAALPWLWPSLRFQLHHAFAQRAPTGWSPLEAVGAVLGAALAQALLWSPPVIWLGARALRGLPGPDRALALGLTAILLVSALVRGVPPEPNWWAPAAIVVVVAFATVAENLSPRARRAILASVLLPTAIAAAHTLRPFLPLPPRLDPTARLHGWSRGAEPSEAPGVGPYGPAAERCAYRGECSEILLYFNKM
jgi:hypothetical protein